MKKFARVLALALAFAMMLSLTAFAAGDNQTTWIELTLEDDERGENGEPYRVKISEESSHYLTKSTKLLPEVVSLINKMYDPKDSSTPMWEFDCWDMKEVMDEGLEAYMDGTSAWAAYLDKHYEDVAHAHGDVGLKDLLKSRTSTLGDIVTNVPHQIAFKNEVKGSNKYGVTYTLTVIRHVDNMPELGINDHSHEAYINGYPDGTIRPNGEITRAEAASILYRVMTDASKAAFHEDTQLFPDVTPDAWYYEAVNTMAAAGIINGYEGGEFRPNNSITRGEIAAMVVRFTERGRNLEDAAFKGVFKDVAENAWYAKVVELANDLGWMVGHNGNFRPVDKMTRAEFMTMVNRILQCAIEKENLPADMKTWPDNTPDKWYYTDVQSATNGHTYAYTDHQVAGQNFNYEIWTGLIK